MTNLDDDAPPQPPATDEPNPAMLNASPEQISADDEPVQQTLVKEEPPMEFHKPKPVHSWREFLKEYAIIVLGVITALAAEQVAEGIHERELAREADAAIRQELAENAGRVAYRLSFQSCIEKRLDEISALLADWSNGKEIPAGIHIGNPGGIVLNDQRWQANLNSGRFSNQNDSSQTAQAFTYNLLHIVDGMVREEYAAWDQLRALEQGSQFLTISYRPRLIEMLATARADATKIALLGDDFVGLVRKENISPDKPFQPVLRGTTCEPLMAGSK